VASKLIGGAVLAPPGGYGSFRMPTPPEATAIRYSHLLDDLTLINGQIGES
jgi:hypothetical protein